MLIPFKTCCDIYQSVYDDQITELIHAGGNTGEELSDYCLMHVGRSLWFEPNPLVLSALQNNCSNARGTHIVMPYGLWSDDITKDLNISNNFQSSSVFDLDQHLLEHPSIAYVGRTQVKLKRYDNLGSEIASHLPSFFPQFVNLDIQGSEFNALMGMKDAISKSVRMIYCEVNRKSLYSGINLVYDIDNLLESMGFLRIKTFWTRHGWGDAVYLRPRVIDD